MYVNDNNHFGGIFYEQEEAKETSDVIFLVTWIVSVVITFLIIINLISFSITLRKREIGILRGLGAHGKDIIKIFIFESLIIGLIV